MQKTYFVKAIWDAEASVWISESDIPGLVIEAESLEEFESLMTELAPEMLAENEQVHNQRVPIEFCVQHMREVAVA